jgi:hypothetical protein
MSETRTTSPAERFAELKRTFRAMIPRRSLRREQWQHVARAASLTQVAEAAVLERALGAKHDRGLIEQMKIEVRRHLVLAGAKLEGAKT